MNAAIFTKPAKGLILASGLIAASSVLAYAQDITVPLGALATNPLSSPYQNPPTGIVTLGGHTFDMSTGNFVAVGNGQSASYTGSWANASSVYVLLNSYDTWPSYAGQQLGTVTITFADGTTQTTALMAGSNVREWKYGNSGTVDSLSDPAAAQVWNGLAYDGTAATIDMLTIPLAGTKTITGVSVNNTLTSGNTGFVFSGLTIDPQPKPTCTRPGGSCSTPAAQHSAAWKWQPQIPGAATTTLTNPHANGGNGNGDGTGGGQDHKAQ